MEVPQIDNRCVSGTLVTDHNNTSRWGVVNRIIAAKTRVGRAYLETRKHMVNRQPTSFCICGQKLNAYTHTSGNQEITAKADDLTMCINCGHWYVFLVDLSLRSATQEEIKEGYDILRSARQGERS